MRAYHFVGKTLRDGSPIPPDGETLFYEPPSKIELCIRGYHASLHPFDALTYAPGNTLCLVEVGGVIQKETDKLVASQRTIIKRINAEDLLYEMAKWSALQVVHLWNPPQIVLEYLKTGKQTLRVAAWDAVGDAARAATWDAARAAARDAARVAAWDAARAAARDAARAAAGDAAWDAVGDAARAATWAAAWDAARAAQQIQFQELVDKEFSK